MAASDLSIEELVPPLAARLIRYSRRNGMTFIGLCGAQGSGKSTLAARLETALAERGKRAVTLGLDEFYLTKAEREALARDVHPLCATRGVPGTHDVALMTATIDALAQAGEGTKTKLPAFFKLDDDRAPESEWQTYEGHPDIVILEGWCIGARAAPDAAWEGPINALEAEEDPDGTWVRWWNRALAEDYVPLWRRFDQLILITVPDLETVIESRLLQEERLAAARGAGGPPPMGRAEVERFVAHYERLTLRIWEDLPDDADVVIGRDAQFRFRVIKPRQL